MKTTVAALIGFLFFFTLTSNAQNAPVVTIGSEMYASASPGTATIPVTVKDFLDIGSFTLTLKYQGPYSPTPYSGVSVNPAFTGINVDSSTPGTLIFSWFGTGITLPDEAHLMDITFSYPSPVYNQYQLSWDTSSNSTCWFKKYEEGTYIDLNDSPKSTYYINGIITSGAPTIYAPVIANAVPGVIYVPLDVTHFSGIGSATLTLVYDPAVLTYSTFTANPSLGGIMNVGSVPGPGSLSRIVIGWYNNLGASLPDGSNFVTLTFQYSNVNGNYSALSWSDTGPSCLFTNVTNDNLYDQPTSFFYKDGLVAGQLSPQTILPKVSNATTGTPVPVSVTANNFTNIRALSLSFKYDPAVVTYASSGYTPNPSLTGLTLTNTPSGPDGKGRIAISWTGSSPVSLANGSSIVSMNFDYISGNTALAFNTGGDSSDYKGAYSKSLYKSPATIYYKDGIISHHLAPVIKVDSVTASTPGQSVNVPVKVTGFSDIGSFTLTLKYDPGVITYTSTTINPTLGGVFSPTSVEPGLVKFVWTGSSANLTDGSALFTLYFTYHGGSSSFQWHTATGSCVYGAGSKGPVPFDEPKSGFYINGAVTPPVSALVTNLKVYLEGPYDLTPGTMKTLLGSTIPLTQPYSGAPWYYTGTESVATVPANVTDWILIELKNTIPWGSSYRRAGFIKNDGSVVAINGSSLPSFSGVPAGNYYIVIRHRNHMPIMSAAPVVLSSSSPLYDFSTGSNKVYKGTSGYKRIDAGRSRWGMVAGDANSDGKVFINDYTDYWVPSFGLSGVYNLGDFNLDGNVFIDDYTAGWVPNFGKTNVLP